MCRLREVRMKDDPFGVRAGLSALDAAKAAGLAPLSDHFDQTSRLARRHEELLASLAEPAILREMREQDLRLAELAQGYVGDLSALAGFNDHLEALRSETSGYRTFQNAAADYAAGIPQSVRDDLVGWTRGASAYDAFQRGALDQVGGVSASDWLDGFNKSATAAGFDALGTLSERALHGLTAEDAGLRSALDAAAGVGYHKTALDIFSAHGTARKLFEAADLTSMNAAVQAVSEQVHARFEHASALRSTDELRALIYGLDVDGLRSAVERFTEATERWAKEQNDREGREVERHRSMFMLTLLLGMAQIILGALAVYLAYGQPQPQKSLAPPSREAASNRSSPKAIPETHPLVAVRSQALTLREGPQTTQRSLTVLQKGQILPVLGRKAGWLRVRYVPTTGDGASITGWVQAKYTTPLEVETVNALLCALVSEPLDGCSE
jgi:hypothetical protein